MACGGFTCTKNALACLNVLYMLVAILLIGVAAVGKASAYVTSIKAMGGMIACGVFLLIIAFVGLIGAIKHHQVLLFFYMIILFLIFLVQFAVACACLATTTTHQHYLISLGWEQASDGLQEKVQIHYNCCGFEESIANSSYSNPACSKSACCEGANKDSPCCLNENVGDQTCPCNKCWPEMEESTNNGLKGAGSIGLFFSFTEIMGIWLTVRYRNLRDPRANPKSFLG